MARVETETLLLPILLTTDPHTPSHCRPLDRNIRYWRERDKKMVCFPTRVICTGEFTRHF